MQTRPELCHAPPENLPLTSDPAPLSATERPQKYHMTRPSCSAIRFQMHQAACSLDSFTCRVPLGAPNKYCYIHFQYNECITKWRAICSNKWCMANMHGQQTSLPETGRSWSADLVVGVRMFSSNFSFFRIPATFPQIAPLLLLILNNCN